MGVLNDAMGFFGFGGGNQPQKPVRNSGSTKTAPAKVSSIRPARSNYGSAVNEMVTIDAKSYADVKVIGEYFRNDLPIVINMAELSEKDQVRVLDFVLGLQFGRHGNLTRVTPKVFLLTPESVAVNPDDENEPEEILDEQD